AISSPPASPLSPWSSPPPQIPFPPLHSMLSPPSLILAPAPPPSLIRSLGYRAAMIRLRDEAASTSHLPPPQLLSTSGREDRPEVNLPPRKRLDIALGPSISTPMATKHLDADLSETPVDQTKYRSKVGALMYLTVSRPNIMHATCYCARYQALPTEKHLTAVKRIFRYLKDTIHMGLWYPKDTGFELTAFSDSDHAGCLDSRKSTSGDYGFHFDKIPMYCDSKAAIAISCNPVQHLRTKHVDVRYPFIKEKVEKGIVELFFVRTEYQLADLFTKALPEERFK
nr:hypothetical protein [Tanacetum cinerariifolium]